MRLIAWTKTTTNTWTANLRGLPLAIVPLGNQHRLVINGQFSTLITDTVRECMDGAAEAFKFLGAR